MKIEAVNTYLLNYPLEDPIGSSVGVYQERQALLVEIVTDDGIAGWGEASAWPPAARTVIESALKPMLLGRDPLDIAVLWHEMYIKSRHFGQKGVTLGAISGIDIALWDILGKAAGLPVHKLLGGAFRTSAQAYAMGLFYRPGETLEQLQERAANLVGSGFRGVKMKIGGAPWKEDIARVRAVREAIGPDALLMVDANRAFNAAAAIALGRQLEEFDLFWFEEPVPPEDLEGYAAVKASLSTFVAGGECEFTSYGFRRLLDVGAIDILQPEICIAGGISECRKIADMAHTAGIFYVPHMHGSALALAASLQLVAALAPVSTAYGITPPLIELDTMRNPLREDLLVSPLEPAGGTLAVPTGPGLGIEINRETVARYSIA